MRAVELSRTLVDPGRHTDPVRETRTSLAIMLLRDVSVDWSS